MPRIIGIDLGTHTVKLSVFEGNFGRTELVEYIVQRVPQDASNRPSTEVILDALADAMQQLNVQAGTVTGASYPTESTALRIVELPFSDRTKVEKTLPFEVESMVPFDMEDMLLVSRVLDIEDGVSSVLAALAPRKSVAERLEGLQQLSVDPKILPVDGDVLGAYATAGVQAVVDIGHTRTVVAVCREGRVMQMRAFGTAGRDLTAALTKAHNIDWMTAEGRKHVADLNIGTTGNVTTAEVEAQWMDDDDPESFNAAMAHPEDAAVLHKALTPLLTNLRSTLIGFEDSLNLDVDEVLLTGGTSGLIGLNAWVGSHLGVPTRRILVSEEAERLGDAGRLALCHAIGEEASANRSQCLDMRQEEFAYRGNLAAMSNVIKLVVAAMVLMILSGITWFAYRTIQLGNDIEALEDRIVEAVIEAFPEEDPERLSDPAFAQAIMAENASSTMERVDLLGSIVSPEPPTLSLLYDLSIGVPKHNEARIEVNELTITETGISFKAETAGYEEATRIETALHQNPKFRDAKKGDEKKHKNGIKFTVTIPLAKADGETSEG